MILVKVFAIIVPSPSMMALSPVMGGPCAEEDCIINIVNIKLAMYFIFSISLIVVTISPWDGNYEIDLAAKSLK